MLRAIRLRHCHAVPQPWGRVQERLEQYPHHTGGMPLVRTSFADIGERPSRSGTSKADIRHKRSTALLSYRVK
jgi:hypothetical protein